jgi:lipopolysaccharide export system permease protein
MLNLKSINKYIIKEYLKSFLIVVAVMLSIIILINLLDEFNFFKAKKDLKFITFLLFVALKIPNSLINLMPFIILFGGIVFFLKIYNYNEVVSLRVMGYSNIQIILIPALTSFIIGFFLIFFFVPFSSSFLKYYEELKGQYNDAKNLIFINQNGIWIIDKNDKEKNIIRIEKIDRDFLKIENITIYNYNNNNDFIKRIDAEDGQINKKKWELNKINIISANKKNKENYLKNIIYDSNTDINEIKNIYKNTETSSLFNINKEMLI